MNSDRLRIGQGMRGLLGMLLFFAGATGCAKTPQAKPHLQPGDHELTLQVGELERRYIVHVPAGHSPGKPLPVVIMLHGGGGTARGAMRETGWARKADAEHFLAVFPDAMPPDPGQPSRFGTNGQAWNDGSGRFHSGEKDIPDVAFIDAMLDDLEARFAIDRRRVYATGFSNGAAMTFRIGVELATRIAAIAPFAGAMWPEPSRFDHPVSLYYITGDADPLNPLDGGLPKFATGARVRTGTERVKPSVRAAVDLWARLLGCGAETCAVDAPSGVKTFIHSGGRNGSEVRFTVIEGHGHIWPGGLNQLPERMVGKPSPALNATDAIWAFFRQHARP